MVSHQPEHGRGNKPANRRSRKTERPHAVHADWTVVKDSDGKITELYGVFATQGKKSHADQTANYILQRYTRFDEKSGKIYRPSVTVKGPEDGCYEVNVPVTHAKSFIQWLATHHIEPKERIEGKTNATPPWLERILQPENPRGRHKDSHGQGLMSFDDDTPPSPRR